MHFLQNNTHNSKHTCLHYTKMSIGVSLSCNLEALTDKSPQPLASFVKHTHTHMLVYCRQRKGIHQKQVGGRDQGWQRGRPEAGGQCPLRGRGLNLRNGTVMINSCLLCCMRSISTLSSLLSPERIKQLLHGYEVLFTLALWWLQPSLHVNLLFTKPMVNYTILSFAGFQRLLQMDAKEILHSFIYINKAGFNLSKATRRGRNIIATGQ